MTGSIKDRETGKLGASELFVQRLEDAAVFPLARVFSGPAVPPSILQAKPLVPPGLLAEDESDRREPAGRQVSGHTVEWRYGRAMDGNTHVSLWRDGACFTSLWRTIKEDKIVWFDARHTHYSPDFEAMKRLAEEQLEALGHGHI